LEVVSGASVEELVRNLDQLLGKGVVVAPKPEIVKEDWFDAVNLRTLREKTATVMKRPRHSKNRKLSNPKTRLDPLPMHHRISDLR
jgi:hypothetical protein